MKFWKYQALGNDYIVLNPKEFAEQLTDKRIRLICDRHFGIGSDGILWGPPKANEKDFGLRIFNPDSSEAEKSGNGLRIFARYLFDKGLVKTQPFTISTPGGVVTAHVHPDGNPVTVEMGKVSFDSEMLFDNLTTVVEAVVKAKPAGAKGQYVISAYLTTSMGPGIKLDLKPTLALSSS